VESVLATQYKEFYQKASACTACGLARGRTQVVVGDGSLTAKVMFIGEAPGYYEDQQGLPFVGAAGQFLNELLAMVGLDRKRDVYICNVIKCRPPGNRDPLPMEVESCRPWLEQQLTLLKPKVIVTLGRFSLAHFLPNESISRVRGKAQTRNGVIIYPVYHPAAALHNGNLRKAIEDDFKKIPDLIQQAEKLSAPEKPPVKEPKQLSMF
jgi:DNA polymerase